MYVLQEMLLGRTDGPPLAEESRARVRAMARELFRDRRLDFAEVAQLGCLAAATGDPELRTAAVGLTDPSNLSARGIPAASQAFVIRRMRGCLQ
jgi:hypothetical protein